MIWWFHEFFEKLSKNIGKIGLCPHIFLSALEIFGKHGYFRSIFFWYDRSIIRKLFSAGKTPFQFYLFQRPKIIQHIFRNFSQWNDHPTKSSPNSFRMSWFRGYRRDARCVWYQILSHSMFHTNIRFGPFRYSRDAMQNASVTLKMRHLCVNDEIVPEHSGLVYIFRTNTWHSIV